MASRVSVINKFLVKVILIRRVCETSLTEIKRGNPHLSKEWLRTLHEAQIPCEQLVSLTPNGYDIKIVLRVFVYMQEPSGIRIARPMANSNISQIETKEKFPCIYVSFFRL